jgi:hypothetical protein
MLKRFISENTVSGPTGTGGGANLLKGTLSSYSTPAAAVLGGFRGNSGLPAVAADGGTPFALVVVAVDESLAVKPKNPTNSAQGAQRGSHAGAH